MSNYLTICQNVAVECNVDTSGNSPTAVTGQTGVLLQIVNWVAQSYREIQNKRIDWRWMRRTFTLNTVAAKDTYLFSDCTDTTDSVAISRFSRWRLEDDNDPPKVYRQSTGSDSETWMVNTTWEDFKSIFKIGAQVDAAPIFISVDPNNQLIIGPAPDTVYVVTGDYMMSPQTLAADGDTPEMPSQFHDLIMYRAMKKYALSESANEVLIAAKEGERIFMPQLEANQLPTPILGAPLA